MHITVTTKTHIETNHVENIEYIYHQRIFLNIYDSLFLLSNYFFHKKLLKNIIVFDIILNLIQCHSTVQHKLRQKYAVDLLNKGDFCINC